MPSNGIRFCVKTELERIIVVILLMQNITYTHNYGPIRVRFRSYILGRPSSSDVRRGMKIKLERPEPACFSINPPAIVSDTAPESKIKGNTPDIFTCYTHTHTHTQTSNSNHI